nr:site-specific DNA-methyltransferase [Nitrosomonas sp.]
MSTNDKSADKEPGKNVINETMLDDEFSLETQKAPLSAPLPKKESLPKSSPGNHNKGQAPEVLSYRYDDKRTNNPHVGMVDTYSDGVEAQKNWQYDPHIDPALNFDSRRSTVENLIDDALASGDKDQMQAALEQLKRMQSPYLEWTGKAERTSFAVDTVSLHVHERIDPATILAAVQKKIRDSQGKASAAIQPDLFHAPFENLPLRDAIDFYKHERDWANRLIAGDSLLVMNSLLQKEGMAGQVQMIYLDPPYGIKYGSNFQPFVSEKRVEDRKDEDLTQEPEMIKAFRDTWELGIHSYLTYLRDRLLLSKELLHESGSVFVQISNENLHLARNLLDEAFGVKGFVSVITVKKTGAQTSNLLSPVSDYLVWYTKNREALEKKFKPLLKDFD